jgi:hypothetical protein
MTRDLSVPLLVKSSSSTMFQMSYCAEIMLSQISPSHLCLAYPPAVYHKIKNSIRFVDINLSLWC